MLVPERAGRQQDRGDGDFGAPGPRKRHSARMLEATHAEEVQNIFREIHYTLRDKSSRRNFEELQASLARLKESCYSQKTFVNCDIRYFNLDYLTENVGSFDSKLNK